MNFWAYQEMPPESAESYKRPKETYIPTYTKAVVTTHTEEAKKRGRGRPPKPEHLKVSKKRKRPAKHGDMAGMIKAYREKGLAILKEKADRIFANGPLTLTQFQEKEGIASRQNASNALHRMKDAGLIEVIGTVGKHPGLQNLWARRS